MKEVNEEISPSWAERPQLFLWTAQTKERYLAILHTGGPDVRIHDNYHSILLNPFENEKQLNTLFLPLISHFPFFCLQERRYFEKTTILLDLGEFGATKRRDTVRLLEIWGKYIKMKQENEIASLRGYGETLH